MRARFGGRIALSGVALTLLVSGLSVAATGAGSAMGVAAQKPVCSVQPAKVKPHKARISVLPGSYRVVAVKRTEDGAIGAPPTTKAGKRLVGWDRQGKPGTGVGSVIIDAHTWPDGSALGNAMLRKLKRGAMVTLSNGRDRGVCYRITKRRSYHRDRMPLARMFRAWGPEQLVIVVCSGKRLGPGNWLRRTVWFGTPISVQERA